MSLFGSSKRNKSSQELDLEELFLNKPSEYYEIRDCKHLATVGATEMKVLL